MKGLYTLGFENVSKCNNIGNDRLIECLDGKAKKCGFSFCFGDRYYCKCPQRAYIDKIFHK